MTTVSEIAPDVFRISTFVPEFDLQFNQFLVRDDEPLLFHTGPRAMFAAVRDAVATLLDPTVVKWIGFSHLEADECGSLREWQQLAPESMAVCSLVGKLVSIDDCMAVRPALGMKDGEVLNTGKYRFRFLHTPHVPHCWEAGLAVRRDPAHALVFGPLSSKRGCRAGHAFGRAGPVPTGARGVSARAAGQLYAVLDTHGADAPSAGRVAAEDLGDDAWVGLCRRRRPRAPRPGCHVQGCSGAEIARESEGTSNHSRLVRAALRGDPCLPHACVCADSAESSLEFFPSA